jgi:crotonobetainyl-CoA:carnitine CoA-transferase CaiB-like acyl-CoA transferase
VVAIEDVADDAQVRHNKVMVEHEHPAMGRVRQPRPPARFSATPAELHRPSSPTLGQHTDEVLTEMGWGARIGELRSDGVIG